MKSAMLFLSLLTSACVRPYAYFACQLLGYAKVVGTLVRAMRVLAVAIQAVPRATRVLRLAAVFIRSYEGRRRSKDLHEASIVIQRRAVRHMALKVIPMSFEVAPCFLV